MEGKISDEKADSIVPKLLYLDYVNKKPINFYIDSPGGLVTAGLAIYDTIQYVGSDIKTICNGLSSGMATLLLSSGRKGYRYCLENARISFCELSTSNKIINQFAERERQIKDLKRMKDLCNKILTENTGQSLGRIEEDCKYWATNGKHELLPKEAIVYGIIDKIYKESA